MRGVPLPATELRAIADALANAAAACNKVRESQSEALRTLVQDYRPLKDIIDAIIDAVDERGAVLDRASTALHRIRRSLSTSHAEARDRVQSMLRSSKYANAIQDAVVTIREGRFVVPIKAEFSGEFPGIVHDTSSSGATLFVEPLAALETNNRLRTLRIEEEREVARVLAALSQRVGGAAAQIERNIDILATLDLLVARARLAIAMAAIEPELTDAAVIVVNAGRHPLLGERAVPQSLRLGGDDPRLLVISGPNMGGKTVALKMVGLFVAMTHCGLQIPAQAGTRIGCFERIFTDIGDEQSIVENASTFSAHLQRMNEILADADDRCLVLVDEIGGGTEPSAGAALAIGILERLIAVGAYGIVTTHATELKLFAHGTPGVANASVRFDPDSFAPTYHLDVGTPGQSLAFPLARAMGIPGEIIERAQTLMDSRERDYEQALADLATLQAQLQTQLDSVEREERHVRTLQDNLRKKTEALEAERRAFARTADERLHAALVEFSAELARRAQANESARPKVTQAQSALLSRVIDEMHRDLGVKPERSSDPQAPRVQPGDRVRVLSMQQDAEVIAENGDNVLVSFGAMRTSVPKSDVRPAGPARKARVRESQGAATLNAASATMSELDVRGKRFIEAEPLVDRWIDEALLAGNSPLRLIHGKGTGLLGRGLQQWLREHAAVKNVRYGDENEGGGGVTIFELR